MIVLEIWDPEKHVKLVNSWLDARHHDGRIAAELYPSTGFVSDGCFCGFLYETGTSLAYLDGFISDPSATKEQRSEALSALVESLVGLAKERGIKMLHCFTKAPTLKSQAKASGFSPMGGDFAFFTKGV